MPTFRLTAARRLSGQAFSALIRLGVAPPSVNLLITIGRKTGLERSVPVALTREHGQTYLVAPYGAVGWVHNARAAGTVRLRHGRRVRECAIREVDATEAGPVLARYIKLAPPTWPYFTAKPGAKVEAFVAEADRHPVFALTARGAAHSGQ